MTWTDRQRNSVVWNPFRETSRYLLSTRSIRVPDSLKSGAERSLLLRRSPLLTEAKNNIWWVPEGRFSYYRQWVCRCGTSLFSDLFGGNSDLVHTSTGTPQGPEHGYGFNLQELSVEYRTSRPPFSVLSLRTDGTPSYVYLPHSGSGWVNVPPRRLKSRRISSRSKRTFSTLTECPLGPLESKRFLWATAPQDFGRRWPGTLGRQF